MRLRISGNREKPIDRILKNILLLNVSLPSLPPDSICALISRRSESISPADFASTSSFTSFYIAWTGCAYHDGVVDGLRVVAVVAQMLDDHRADRLRSKPDQCIRLGSSGRRPSAEPA